MQVRSNPSRCSELPAFAASAAGRSAMSRSRTRKEASTVQGRQLSQETLLHKRRRNVSTPYGIAKTAQTPCRSSQSDDNASAAVTMFRSGFGQRCQEYVSHKVDWPFSIFDFYTPIRSFFPYFLESSSYLTWFATCRLCACSCGCCHDGTRSLTKRGSSNRMSQASCKVREPHLLWTDEVQTRRRYG